MLFRGPRGPLARARGQRRELIRRRRVWGRKVGEMMFPVACAAHIRAPPGAGGGQLGSRSTWRTFESTRRGPRCSCCCCWRCCSFGRTIVRVPAELAAPSWSASSSAYCPSSAFVVPPPARNLIGPGGALSELLTRLNSNPWPDRPSAEEALRAVGRRLLV